MWFLDCSGFLTDEMRATIGTAFTGAIVALFACAAAAAALGSAYCVRKVTEWRKWER